MSAIFGLHYLDRRQVNPRDIRLMGEHLRHRGTDRQGFWSGGSIGMGHNLLWTTPESIRERQPVRHGPARLVLVADARIDNRDELLSTFSISGQDRKNISDSRLILAAYLRWGEKCPRYLIGDFAFVVWDAARNRLFCARDPLGIRPLYYVHNTQCFAFASEIKALLALEGIEAKINEGMVADYLLRIARDTVSTFYKDIYRLPPGHSLLVAGRRQKMTEYWSALEVPSFRFVDEHEYTEAFRSIFTEAVSCRLRSAFPVGSSLSGGLDSSSIACTAAEIYKRQNTGHRLHTFSAVFPSLTGRDLELIDERRHIEAVLFHYQFIPHWIRADRLSPLANLRTTVHQMDEPVFGPNLYIHQGLFEAARKGGVRIFLDGIDGDSVVSYGYERLPEMVYAGRWRQLWHEARCIKEVHQSRISTTRLAWRYGLKPAVQPLLPRFLAAFFERGATQWQNRFPLEPHFAEQIQADQRLKTGEMELTARDAAQHHRESLRAPALPAILEMANKAAALHGLEDRYPFLDRRLVEFCLGMPPEQKLLHGWSRIVLRRAMMNILPVSVQWRPSKANLSPNFVRRMLDRDRALLEHAFFHNREVVSRYVDTIVLRKRYQACLSNIDNCGDTPVQFYCTLALWYWLEVFA